MVRTVALVGLALALTGCGDANPMMSAVDAADPTGDGDHPPIDATPVACRPTSTHPLDLAHGAFPISPDHPNAIVHFPPNFDPTPPIDVVVYIHGFNNCITTSLGEVDAPCATTTPRSAMQLAMQLADSTKNAVLVLPEVRYDEATGDPGQLGVAGGFRELVEEALGTQSIALADVGRVIVASHSGGYRAVSLMSTIGGLPVDELWLFDSLYGEIARFDEYVNLDLASYAGTDPDRRFSIMYTDGGGTLANSQAMADRAAAWVEADPTVLVDDRTTATWTDDIYRHGLLFKHSALSHDGVPRYYFEHMLATSRLRTSTCLP